MLLASVGTTPAQQMRHGTAQHVRRAGYGEQAVAELLAARAAYEDGLRGRADPGQVQRALDLVAERPWRHLAWLPERFAPDDSWPDLDFHPAPVFAGTRCPVLAVWIDDDPWVPVAASEAAWREAAGERLAVLRLPGDAHAPEPGDPRYEQALVARVRSALGAPGLSR